jgi:hypothetical protein
MSRQVRAIRALPIEVGSCVACTGNISLQGAAAHLVWQVELRSVQVRVCDECLQELLRQLGVKKPRREKA